MKSLLLYDRVVKGYNFIKLLLITILKSSMFLCLCINNIKIS